MMNKEQKPTIEDRLRTIENRLGIGIERVEIKLPRCRDCHFEEITGIFNQISDTARKHMPGLISATTDMIHEYDGNFLPVIVLTFKENVQ